MQVRDAFQNKFIDMNTKICSKCGIEKPTTEFYKDKHKSDGLQRECKECHNSRHAGYYAANRDKRLAQKKDTRRKVKECILQIKINDGCCICGLKDPACLDFHHLGDKKDNVSDIARHDSLRMVQEEIEKCVVICANCHRKLHYYSLTLDELKQLGRKRAA